MTMWLIRHTTVVSRPGFCYGRSEVPLATSFVDDVKTLREELETKFLKPAGPMNSGPSRSPRVIWTSPSPRCRRLADTLKMYWEKHDKVLAGYEVRSDSRLVELNFGAWEGQEWERLSGPEVDAWMRDPWRERPPGGETAKKMWARVASFRDERRWEKNRRKDGAESDDLVITHAGVIRAWRSIAEGRDWQEFFGEKIPFGSVWKAD
jgi:alpha-ribazole phosphatase